MFVFALSYSELLTADLILPGECKDPELHYYTGKLENSHKVWLGNHFIPSLYYQFHKWTVFIFFLLKLKGLQYHALFISFSC